MKVTVTAVGNLKTFVPDETDIALEAPVSLAELKILAGIPEKKTVSYAVNGRLKKADMMVSDGDQVKFLMVVGAG